MVLKKHKKPYGDENNEEIEGGNVYLDQSSRLISLAGVISWQIADKLFNVLAGFESLLSRKPLTIYINSEGGDTYSMFRIYDHIRNSSLPVVTIAAGYAASAGLIIFLAGDLRKIFPNTFLGFHAPTIYFVNKGGEGPAEAIESAFHQSRLLDAMVKIVKNNSNMSEKMIKEYFRILNRIDAKTALSFGLAHQLIEPPKKTLPKSWQKILKEQK